MSRASCADQLRMLWLLLETYRVTFGGRERRPPPRTGGAFWLAFAETEPPMIDPDELEVYVCPERRVRPRKGFTRYRGPAGDAADLAPRDPLGACLHRGGKLVLLTRNGRVRTVARDGPRGREALLRTRP